MNSPSPLSEDLLERVLERLGFIERPEPTHSTLVQLYAAWCQKIPFDNVRKLIHVRSGHPGPLPGATAEDYFTGWLRFGAGGTCWSGAGACHALLSALGFHAQRGIATMLVAPHLPPNHGTVCVEFGEDRYLVDTSILHGEPLPLIEGATTEIAHPAWGVRCEPREGRWHIVWRPIHKTDGFDCRLERFGAEEREYLELYEMTRGWSPFNFELSARINRGEEVVGAAFGKRVRLLRDGSVESAALGQAERRRVLLEEFGMSEEIVNGLPADVSTPPPPGSATAQAAGEM